MYQRILTKIKKLLKKEKPKYKKRNYWIVYSCVFLIMLCFVFGSFYVNKKSFIWSFDGLNQHFPALIYLSQYLREFLKNLFSGTFQLPMWDLRVGLGSDVLTSLNYYSFGDPLDLIAVFFSADKMELCYNLLVLLRLYLAGVFFSAYCFEIGKNRFPTLIGSLSYIFCGYSLMAVRHPFFINPMIYLPLVFIGIERVFKKRGSGIFIFSIFLTAISNFYFLYMISIFAFLYALLKFCFQKDNRTMKNFFSLLMRFIGRYIIAIGLSAVILLPVCLAFLGNARGDVSADVNYFHYNINYYLNLIPNLLKGDMFGYWSIIGFNSISVICLAVLFRNKTKNSKKLKLCFCVLTIFLFLPAAGLAFNGFAYVVNRWVFCYSFVVALITVETIPILLNLKFKDKRAIQIIAVVFGFFIIMLYKNRTNENLRSVVVLFIIAGCICILETGKTEKKIGVLALTGASIFSFAFGCYSITCNNYVGEFMDNNSVYKNLMNLPEKEMAELNKNEIYRVQDKDAKNGNFGMAVNANATTSFFSLSGKNLLEYSMNLGNEGMKKAFQVKGFDNRTPLLTLAGVKYLALSDSQPKGEVPYGFKKLKRYHAKNPYGKKVKGWIYENQYNLPLAYVYNNTMSKEEYLQLNLEEREQVQIQAAIAEQKFGNIENHVQLNENIILLNKKELCEQINKKKGIRYEDGKIYVSRRNSKIKVTLPSNQLKGQLYLEIIGLKFKSENYNQLRQKKLQKMSRIQQNQEKMRTGFWEEAKASNVSIHMNDTLRVLNVTTKANEYYFGQEDFLLNFGASAKKENPVLTIKFQKTGVYSIDDMQVLLKDMESYKSDVHKLQKNSLKNIKMDTNQISGNANLQKNGILCLAVPYSKGWSAKVDGRSVEVEQINDMYMGIELSSGQHDITFEYKTPGLRIGIVISVIFLVCILVFRISLYILYRERK